VKGWAAGWIRIAECFGYLKVATFI
jgi:hypothetical protein